MSAAQVHNTIAMLVQTYGDLVLAEKLRGDAAIQRAEKAEAELKKLLEEREIAVPKPAASYHR